MIVKLAPQEIVTAASIGMRRQVFAMHSNLRQYGNGKPEWFDAHIMGAMAEFVVAKVVNLFWPAHIGVTDQPDVGGLIEVRLRRIPGSGTDLAIRPKDIVHKHRPFVQVLGSFDGTLEIAGWLYGREAAERGGAWCESNEVTFIKPPYRPIEELVELCRSPLALQQAKELAA